MQDLSKRSVGKLSLHKFPVRGLLARSVAKISAEVLYKSCLGKIYVYKFRMTGLLAISLEEISVQALYTGSIGKIFYKRSEARPLRKLSIIDFLVKSLRKISLTIKMSTAPQGERSDRPKVARGLPEHMLEYHKTLHAFKRTPQKNESLKISTNSIDWGSANPSHPTHVLCRLTLLRLAGFGCIHILSELSTCSAA